MKRSMIDITIRAYLIDCFFQAKLVGGRQCSGWTRLLRSRLDRILVALPNLAFLSLVHAGLILDLAGGSAPLSDLSSVESSVIVAALTPHVLHGSQLSYCCVLIMGSICRCCLLSVFWLGSCLDSHLSRHMQSALHYLV